MTRRATWAWTIPAAILGWLAAGALFEATIPECGWDVIRSGIVSERVWNNHRGILTFTTVVALLWVVGYSRWASRRTRHWAVYAFLCTGCGATAWAVPWILVAYTLDDHWSGGKPSENVPPLGDGSCGLDVNPLGLLLVGGGFIGIAGWVALANFRDDSRRTT